MALFRKSFALEANETTRVQLIESLLQGLRTDFAAYRESLDELGHLVKQPRHRNEFLRVKAIGLQRAGEVREAFDTYMLLADEQAQWQSDDVDAQLTVRRDRWIREQLAQLRDAADPQVTEHIDGVVKSRLDEALAAGSTEALRSFLGMFGPQPLAAAARDALFDKLTAADLLEKNLLLEDQVMSVHDAEAAPATARMARALQAAGRPELAAAYYRRLAELFADVPGLEGKTGRQWIEELPADDPVRAQLIAGPWPTGNVTVSEKKTSLRGRRGVRTERTSSLELVGPIGPLLEDVSLSVVSDPETHLIATDGYGRSRFRILLAEQGVRRIVAARSAYNVPSVSYTSGYGGLVVLSMGTQLVAIDTLREGDSSANRVLWSEDLNDQIGGLANMQSVVPRAVSVKWGGARYVPEDGYGRRFGSIGPVNSDGVYFQRLHDLHCVDPLSGKVIWTRKNLPLGLDLFGDGEYLICAPADKSQTLVLRAATGELLSTRQIAPIEDRMTTLGRNLLCWNTRGGKHQLEMRDVPLDEALWSYTFAPGSKAAIVSQEVVGVFQPDGEFSLVRLSDGKRLAQQPLAKEKTLLGIYVLPWEGGYLLATNSAAPANSNRSVQPFPKAPDCPLISGRVYAFDRETGEMLWREPVSVTKHGLLLTQPRNLPALVLLRQVTRPGPISSRDPKLSVMCIDKRSGKVVYHEDDLQGTTVANCTLEADPAARTVSIELPNQVITLNYSDAAPEGQAERRAPVDQQLATRVILDVLGIGAPVAQEAPLKDAVPH